MLKVRGLPTKCTHLDKTANVLANNEFSGTIITLLTMGHKIHAFLFTKQQGGSNNFKISQGYLIKYQLVAGWCLFLLLLNLASTTSRLRFL